MFQEGSKQRQGIPCSSTDSLSKIDFRFCGWTIDLRSYDSLEVMEYAVAHHLVEVACGAGRCGVEKFLMIS